MRARRIRRPPRTRMRWRRKFWNTAALAKDVFQEGQILQGGGGVVEDESRYEVILRRFFARDASEWKGETSGGCPQFFPLKTVDLLVGGKKLQVFDKSNRKLWESQLAFKVDGGGYGSGWRQEEIPAVETKDSLCFFDQGVLTAFDLKSGNVRWRLSSVGISRIQLDEKGALYVTTTSASPETLRNCQQVTVGGDVKAVVMKVDPTTGKVIWQIGRAGDECYITGKFLYVSRAQISHWDIMGAVLRGDTSARGEILPSAVPEHFRIDRFNPKTGKRVWEYYRKGAPIAQDFQKNRIMLLFPQEIQVLGFYSL